MPTAAVRKPLDAQLVGKINADAMKALGDVKARRKWGDSNSSSPVSTNMLCAEIARLNMAIEQIATVCADNAAPSCDAHMALNFIAQIVANQNSR